MMPRALALGLLGAVALAGCQALPGGEHVAPSPPPVASFAGVWTGQLSLGSNGPGCVVDASLAVFQSHPSVAGMLAGRCAGSEVPLASQQVGGTVTADILTMEFPGSAGTVFPCQGSRVILTIERLAGDLFVNVAGTPVDEGWPGDPCPTFSSQATFVAAELHAAEGDWLMQVTMAGKTTNGDDPCVAEADFGSERTATVQLRAGVLSMARVGGDPAIVLGRISASGLVTLVDNDWMNTTQQGKACPAGAGQGVCSSSVTCAGSIRDYANNNYAWSLERRLDVPVDLATLAGPWSIAWKLTANGSGACASRDTVGQGSGMQVTVAPDGTVLVDAPDATHRMVVGRFQASGKVTFPAGSFGSTWSPSPDGGPDRYCPGGAGEGTCLTATRCAGTSQDEHGNRHSWAMKR